MNCVAPQTIAELVDAAGAAWPDELACVDGDRRVTFRELRDEVVRAAAALAAPLAPHSRLLPEGQAPLPGICRRRDRCKQFQQGKRVRPSLNKAR